MASDGGANIWEQLYLSGEPPIRELEEELGNGPKSPMTLLEYQALGQKRENYRQSYREYWNSTITTTGTGRPVDALIMPVAPHAAVIPGRYYHYGKTAFALPRQGQHGIMFQVRRILNLDMQIIQISSIFWTIQASLYPSPKPIRMLTGSMLIISQSTMLTRKIGKRVSHDCCLDCEIVSGLIRCNSDDADMYDGAPVGIQIVSRQFQEERCLTLASEVVTALEEQA